MAVTINGTTGIETNTDTGKLKVGASDDLTVEHDGSHSRLRNTTGYIILNSDTGVLFKNAADNTNYLVCNSTGGTLEGNWAGKVGLQEADMWSIGSDFTMSTSGAAITANFARINRDYFDRIGTGMSESSGIFSYPRTGKWLIQCYYSTANTAGDSKYNYLEIQTTNDNASYGGAAAGYTCNDTTNFISNGYVTFIHNVDDVSNDKVRFANYAWSGNTTFYGNSASSVNCFTFIRLGD